MVDKLTDRVKRGPPWTMLFADDVVICGGTRGEVEGRFESWKYALEGGGVEVSESKTECLCMNGGNGDETVKMENTRVPGVKGFGCLGSAVQESGDCEREVGRRVRGGWSVWRSVSGVVCDRRLPAGVKGKLCSSVVGPAMVCGLETEAIVRKQVGEIGVAKMKMLRFAVGMARRDKIGNEHIRSAVREERLEIGMEKAGLRWCGHVMRKDRGYVGEDGGGGVAGKEEKRETKEKIFRYGGGECGKGWCGGDRC